MSKINTKTDFILCLFFGYFGVHKFYERKWLTGILYLFTFGIFFIGWIYDCINIGNKLFKKTNYTAKSESYSEHINNYIPTGNKQLDDYYRIEKQYLPILEKHRKNVEEIDMLYTIANNISTANSPQMQQVIDLCIEDIKLAPQILNYCQEIANNYNDNLENHLINYTTFSRLAIIYEKQKEYQKAIDICKMAINLGFYKDGTTGQIPGRLARLVRKSNKQKSKINKIEN